MSDQNQIIIYQTDDGKISVDTLLREESLWLNAHQIAKLFEIDRSGIIKHIKNIYKTGELEAKTTCAKIAQVAKDGKKRTMDYYNLDVVISVGYRVNSIRGTQFRIWATQRLKEYLLQGFSLNEVKLKNGKDTEYFDKLQEKIREIRLSERIFYQKIKDIYTTSVDYNPKAQATIRFFQTVQNKLLWAISKQTAAEIVYNRINSEEKFLGMTSCDKETEKEIKKQDTIIAKNYLNEKEIRELGLIVEQYLAFAESMAQSKISMSMQDWIEQLDLILKMNRKNLLNHRGKISHTLARTKSEKEFEKFQAEQRKIEKEESLKELEKDLKKISNSTISN
jgi:hypothetical protein